MACKDDEELKPWTVSIVKDATTQTRTDYCIDNIKEFVSFFATQSRKWLKGKSKPISLLEAQLLGEVARSHEVTVMHLSEILNTDADSLKGILEDLYLQGLVSKTSIDDVETPTHFSLTELGRNKQKTLDSEFRNNVAKTLGTMSLAKQTCLVDAVNTIKTVLSSNDEPSVAYSLRSHQPGDMGWIVYRHAVLYLQEYGWGEQFEPLVAEVTAQFLRNYDPKLDRCLIAERNGEIVGSIFLIKTTEGVAQLRLLLVEPSARGLGIGSRLVDECIQFARQAGYQKIVLWTHTILHSALRIYEAVGFKLTKAESHDSFGKEEVGQTWELEL